MTTILGIFIGLLAALMQSSSYVFSGKYMRESGRSIMTLLSPSFAIMSLASLLVLPFFLPAVMPPLRDYLGPALLCIGFCILGNIGLFFMLKTVDASRASPLLAIKVPLLAVFYFTMGVERYSAWQWLGVFLVVPAAWLLCKSGRVIPLKALLWLLFGCLGYGASDLCIKQTLEAFKPVCGSLFQYAMLSIFVVYASGGVYGLLGLLIGPRPSRQVWIAYVLPFSFCWLLAMVALFSCFALLGVVEANIVQSTRGLISVIMGWFIAKAGYVNLEDQVPRGVLYKRIASAVLIILAIVLFNVGDSLVTAWR